jgi:transposase
MRAIARELGCSHNTVRRCLRDEDARRYGPRAPRETKLEPFHAYLRERIEHACPRWISAAVLPREIAERGSDGGITQLKQWLAPSLARRARAGRAVRDRAGRQMQAVHDGAPRAQGAAGDGGHCWATAARAS